MDELINDFIAETRDMLQAIAGAIVAWEANPADRERLDEIFRFVHTVKGNCGFFDLPRLRALSHAAEDVLAEVRAGKRQADAPLVSAVLGVIDRIGELVLALETGEALASEDDEQLIAALGGEAAGPTAEPAEPSAAPVVAPEEGERRKATRSIRLSVDLLDRMMSGVSDAVLARNELARRLRDLPRDVAVEAAFERMSGCIAEIRDAITRTRMQRIDSLFAALPRMVRDLSAELGKLVRLELDGGDVELDREMIEMIRDPLTHIIRNAIDHGLESPEARTEAGKPAQGRLAISARQSGNQILIEIVDDGRGIDTDALVRKAVAAGLVTAERADLMSPAQRLELIFAPGLSTAGAITAISGRGVGMDVVRANVERIGGVIDMDSRPGEGVRLCIRVPLTLTIIPALTVSAGGQIFAIPRSAIDEILRLGGDAVRVDHVGESDVATVRGRRVALVDLPALLGMPGGAEDTARKLIVLKPAGADVYALAVDAVYDHEELVVKPAAPPVMTAGVYAGTTLADDGRPILVLDPSGIAKAARLSLLAQEAAPGPDADDVAARAGATALLFRALDGAARAVPVSLIERIEDVSAADIQQSGGRLRVTVDDQIVPLAGCAEPPADGKLRVLRLTDGAAEVAYAFAEVIDIRPLEGAVSSVAAPGEVAGVLLVDGLQVELLDVHWLFAAHVDAPLGDDGPVCALPVGDPWIDTMLRPLLEGLGYRIVAAGEGVAADIFIAGTDDTPPAVGGTEILRLRASPEPASENDSSIYRYDRDALLSALGAAGGRRHG
ncbi:chemotaxis protein CheA [Sphingosinicella sp.]|uniref:chemotaxis protein CheA n=1 Tax=Sphingosinicella sp. TaxID=1917971 RepID=UPI004038323A